MLPPLEARNKELGKAQEGVLNPASFNILIHRSLTDILLAGDVIIATKLA